MLKIRNDLEQFFEIILKQSNEKLLKNSNCLLQVKDDDVIETADVDAFPMTKQIISPIVLLPERSIWLYRYGFTLSSGATFMMPFIGCRVDVWKKILRYKRISGVVPVLMN